MYYGTTTKMGSANKASFQMVFFSTRFLPVDFFQTTFFWRHYFSIACTTNFIGRPIPFYSDIVYSSILNISSYSD